MNISLNIVKTSSLSADDIYFGLGSKDLLSAYIDEIEQWLGHEISTEDLIKIKEITANLKEDETLTFGASDE